MTVAATSDQIERDLQALLNLVERGDRDLVRRAFEFARAAHAQQTRVSGEPYIPLPAVPSSSRSCSSRDIHPTCPAKSGAR